MTRMLPAADCASRNRLASVVEWSKSSPSMPFESKKAVPASSKETHAWSCYWLTSSGPIRTPYYVYTKLELCASWLIMEEPVVRSVPPRSRRFLSEKQGKASPRATKLADQKRLPISLSLCPLQCRRGGEVIPLNTWRSRWPAAPNNSCSPGPDGLNCWSARLIKAPTNKFFQSMRPSRVEASIK